MESTERANFEDLARRTANYVLLPPAIIAWFMALLGLGQTRWGAPLAAVLFTGAYVWMKLKPSRYFLLAAGVFTFALGVLFALWIVYALFFGEDRRRNPILAIVMAAGVIVFGWTLIKVGLRPAPAQLTPSPAKAPDAPKASLKLDPTLGDLRAQAQRKELLAGVWQGTAKFLSTDLSHEDRQFYVELLSALPGRPPVFDDWVRAEPKNGNAYLLRGRNATAWAWEARGSGTADTVTEEGERLFIERLDLAHFDLKQAAEMNASDPRPWAAMIRVGMGLNWEQSAIVPLFNRAIELNPQDDGAHRDMLTRLCQKWGGSHELMFKFARNRNAAFGEGSGLYGLIAAAHCERWLYAAAFERNPNHAAYWQQPAVRAEIVESYRKSLGSPKYKKSRLTINLRNEFAFVLWLVGEAGLAGKELDLIEKRVTSSPWCFMGDPIELVDRARQDTGRNPLV